MRLAIPFLRESRTRTVAGAKTLPAASTESTLPARSSMELRAATPLGLGGVWFVIWEEVQFLQRHPVAKDAILAALWSRLPGLSLH